VSASERERVPYDVCNRGARGAWGCRKVSFLLHNSVRRCSTWSTRLHINAVRVVRGGAGRRGVWYITV
jgi:hypothetical protein